MLKNPGKSQPKLRGRHADAPVIASGPVARRAGWRAVAR